MNLKRTYNQNRGKIWRTIAIIVVVLLLIQLLNYFATQKNKNKKNDNETTSESNKKIIISENTIVDGTNSKVTGDIISVEKITSLAETINEFIEYCNNGSIENAYELLTDECKEKLYPTITSFKSNYCDNIFYESKICEISNWAGNTCLIKLKEDILASGNAQSDSYIEDYFTVKTVNGEKKLNINGYIGKEKINKTTEKNRVSLTATSKDIFMDYEIYNFSVKNNSDNVIALDSLTSPKTIYLQNASGAKFYSYSNELPIEEMIIKSKHTNEISIKFVNSYDPSRVIKSINFSKMIQDFQEYNKLENKSNYNKICEFIVEL